MSRIRKNDTVIVLSGRDKGKTGKVLKVDPRKQTALVEKVNMLKHFERRSQQNPDGGVIEREAPIRLCKLTLVSDKNQRPVRVGYQASEGKEKIRIARPTGEAIDKK